MRWRAVPLIALVLWTCQAGTPSLAGTPKNYAYLAVQGRLSWAGDGRALTGATVTLRDDATQFQTLTDTRGVFVFDRLPPARYEVEVRTADGATIRDVHRFDASSPDLTMLDLTIGKGGRHAHAVKPIVIDGSRGSVEVTVPDPRTRWDKAWKEALIFAGAAALLAL